MSKNNDNTVIKKVRKEKEFAQISNDLINNRGLSYKALGILTYILSKPDDWEVYMNDLIRDGVEGEKSVRNGINELIEKRYVQRYRVFNKETGKVHHWETLVSETPFSSEEIISSVKETYALKSDGTIAYKKMVLGTFERLVPIVIDREVTLVSQNGKVENKSTTFPKGTSRKPTSRKRSTTNTNITKKDFTNTDISSSKGNATDSINPLVKLFNESICELKKTTTAKFLNYVSKYDADFIASVIEYCEQQGAKSFAYFEKAIENYISKGLVTTSDMKASIENFRNENKAKKNSAIKEKEEAKNAEAFEQAMEIASIDEMASIGEEIAVAVEAGDAESIDHIKESIKENISDIQFNTWFASTDFMKNNDVVYVSCCNGFSADIISKRYSVVLISALQENNIGYNKIEYIIKQ